MTSNRYPACNWLWRAALLLALAGAGCAPPAVKDSGQPSPPAAAPVAPVESKPPASEKSETAAPAPVVPALSPAEQELLKGITSYENGDYKVATKELQTALSLGLTPRGDQAKAHKYLAFINCVSGRPNGCREEFRKAFAADPGFDLTAAEAGHPMWGPVFRSVKTAVARATPK